MAERQYHLKFDGSRSADVDAYLEYHRIVGDDDGGKLFTPAEYEKYKKKVLPMRLKNRLFTSWTSPTGMDCKQIGPETPCFCQHRYKQHKTDFEVLPTERPILLPCRVKGCKCVAYHYVPMNGGQPIRCSCKHLSDDHSEVEPFYCKKNNCLKCQGFRSSFTCGCMSPVRDHRLVVEPAADREARGHPVGQATPYVAMGGITGFSSLAEGYMRLDPSGRGAPSKEYLEQPITATDDPFLRSNVRAIRQHEMSKRAIGPNKGLAPDDEIFDDIAERISSMRNPGESDMDFFERRYQERLKAEKAASRRQLTGPTITGQRKAVEAKPTAAKSRARMAKR